VQLEEALSAFGVYAIKNRFNSILVQLEVALRPGCGGMSLIGFNSILVQLEAAACWGDNRAPGGFQFHIGAIRRPRQVDPSRATYRVSIPYWCN